MQTNWKTKIHQDKNNCCFELGDEYVNKAGLEYVRVEEQQKDDNHSEQDAHILNSKWANNNKLLENIDI